MQIGDVIARLQDGETAGEALSSLGDLALTAHVAAVAAQNDVSEGEAMARLVGQFVSRASDDDWLALIGWMSRAADPGQVFLRRALAHALSTAPPASAQSLKAPRL